MQVPATLLGLLGAIATTVPIRAQDMTDTVELRVGRSRQLTAPWPVKGISVTDPEVVGVEVVAPTMILLSGKSRGRTDIVLWSEDGTSRSLDLVVRSELRNIESDLSHLFPDARLALSESSNALVLKGELANAEQAVQLRSYFEALELTYVDMTSLPGVQQVQVQVRVAEVSRNTFRALGVNGFAGGRDAIIGSTLGGSSGGAINPFSIGPPDGASATGNIPFQFNGDVNVSPAVTLFAGFPRADLELFLQALAENQFLRVLAEPTLVALSGEEASFLAGGEFPIPVVQGGTAGGASSVTIEYKEFGVGLHFLPQVLGGGKIRMSINAELSELSDVGAVEIQGFRVPSVLTRRTETTLELHSGQTFAMSGLISESTSAQAAKTPMLGDLPIIGTLFRSVRYRTGETELLVLVTASLVEPLSVGTLPPLPGTTHLAPSDWELYVQGRLDSRTPARLSPEESAWLRELGFDRLEGPGPWATHAD